MDIFGRVLFYFTAFYGGSYADPYSWGDSFPSCHPIIEEHHSPINLDHQMDRDLTLEALELKGFDTRQPGEWTLKNNGHSVVLQVERGMEVRGGGLPGDYTTLQLHFHWGSNSTNGSEHTVNGRRYPMEMHIVNMKTDHYPNFTAALEDPTGLAVLGVFIDVAYAESDSFNHLTNLLPAVAYKGKTAHVTPFPLSSLLPMKNISQYYRYHGSLTTPPCSKVVVWTVYEVPIYISYKQLGQFVSGVYHSEEGAEPAALLYNNFRHVHETFSRKVYASRDATLLSSATLPVYSLLPCLIPVLSVQLP